MTAPVRALSLSAVPLIDAHNHLADARLSGLEEAIFADYDALGVERAAVNGTEPADWDAVAELAKRRPRATPFFGLHPWRVGSAPGGWRERLASLLAEWPGAGVGEIGLDRWIPDPDLAAQQDAFRWQLRLAARESRPVAIHCLKAWGPLLDALRSEPISSRGFLVHSYGGSAETARELADLGAYFSISGYFALPRKAAQAEVFKSIPIERLLVETDAPDMLGPESCVERALSAGDGKAANHPANIAAVYRFAAALRKMDTAAFEERIAENWRRFAG